MAEYVKFHKIEITINSNNTYMISINGDNQLTEPNFLSDDFTADSGDDVPNGEERGGPAVPENLVETLSTNNTIFTPTIMEYIGKYADYL